jgi:hypothetical protein
MKRIFLILSILCFLFSTPLRADHFIHEPAKERAEHTHYAVVFEKGHGEEDVGHFPVLVIRAKGDYQDIETRAKYIAERLNNALDFLPKGARLQVVQEGSEWSIFIAPTTGEHQPIRVLNVHSDDAQGESQHCGRRVDPHLLARYWKAWLEDFVTLFIHHRMPSNLTETYTGLVLKKIYMDAYTHAKTFGDGVINEKSIHDAVDLLADKHWRMLNDLAGCVVKEF